MCLLKLIQALPNCATNADFVRENMEKYKEPRTKKFNRKLAEKINHIDAGEKEMSGMNEELLTAVN